MALPFMAPMLIGAGLSAGGSLLSGLVQGQQARRQAREMEQLAGILAARAGGRVRQNQISRGLGVGGRSQFATEALGAGAVAQQMAPQIAALRAQGRAAVPNALAAMLSGAGGTLQGFGTAQMTGGLQGPQAAGGGQMSFEQLMQLLQLLQRRPGAGMGQHAPATADASAGLGADPTFGL